MLRTTIECLGVSFLEEFLLDITWAATGKVMAMGIGMYIFSSLSYRQGCCPLVAD